MTEFNVIEGDIGGHREDYRPGHSTTYIILPYCVRAQTADDAVRHGKAFVKDIDAVAKQHMAVRFVGRLDEATYVILSNAVTALESISDAERQHVIGQIPKDGRDRLLAALLKAEP